MITRLRIGGAFLLALVVFGGGAMIGVAQQATPNSAVAPDSRSFPATINEGTCDQIGQVWYNLAPVGLPEGSSVVAPPAIPAYQSETTIPAVQLDNFANGNYIMVIGSSQEDPATPVACGLVGGTRVGDDLLFGLLPQGGTSKFAAVAKMSQSGADVSVTVYLTTGVETTDMATPAAAATPMQTPVAGSENGGGTSAGGDQSQQTIEMVDIAFNPKEITIPADTDVTITLHNTGAATHNFNIDALNVKSGDIQPGQSGTVTINAAAGTYDFYCSIPGHKEAGMVGKIIVQ